MRNLLRCRRGSAAFATVIALVPLIGVIALGGEAASWYVTKQHAQNAADAAAYSGALYLACSLSGSCTDTETVAYRGNEFAAQNGFCNSGDTVYPGSACATSLPAGTAQKVTVVGPTPCPDGTANCVKATVQQTQPAYLAVLLVPSPITIGAQATAEVGDLNKPCVLSLSDPISFGGSANVNASACGMASNNNTTGSVSFTGGGFTVTGKITGEGGCSENTGTPCSTVGTYSVPAVNPLSGLNAPMAALSTSTTYFPGKSCSTLTAYNSSAKATECYNTSLGSASLNGVYYLSGNFKINGSTSITGTATLVLLPGSTFSISGNAKFDVSAETTISSTSVPAALSSAYPSVASLLSGVLVFDPESGSVKISGNSLNVFNGVMYFPNADVTFTGSTNVPSCTELIAYGVSFTGSAAFNNSGCPASDFIFSQYVSLVQ